MARSWSARTVTARSGGSRTAASEYIGDQADVERPARHVKAGDQQLGLGTISSSARARGRLRFASAPWFRSQRVARTHCQLKRPWYARRVGGAAARVGE